MRRYDELDGSDDRDFIFRDNFERIDILVKGY